MRLLDGLAELLAPTRCAGCDLPGEVFCECCAHHATRYGLIESCPRCGAPYGHLVCTECWQHEYAFEACISLGDLTGPLARAIVLHKDANERRLGHALAALLADRIAGSWPSWPDGVAWVPPTPAALQRRGFDHARGIASPLAAALDLPALRLLDRGGGKDQRSLGRMARASNAADAFRVLATPPPRVLLIDDVLTTGATAEAASTALLSAGAEAVRVGVLARAW